MYSTPNSWWSRLRLALRLIFFPGPSAVPPDAPPAPTERKPLVLRNAAITRRVDSLFKAMSTDYLLREQFVTDPTQILSEYVEGRRLPPQQASVSNQLLYSVMSNPRLLRWLRDYGIERQGRPLSRQEFMVDFGRAVIEQGGDHVVLSLIRASVEQESVFALGGVERALTITSSPVIASGVIVKTDQRTINDSNSTQSFEHSTTNVGTGPGTSRIQERAPTTTAAGSILGWTNSLRGTRELRLKRWWSMQMSSAGAVHSMLS